MAEVEVEVTFRDNVKPSSPTPPELRTHTLSWFDQFAPSNSVAFILFFQHDATTPSSSNTLYTEINRLKASLSHALTLYYPFAGRLEGNSHVNCDDRGVYFIGAKVSSPLAPLLHRPHGNSLVRFLPVDLADGALLAVQLTTFSCGGAALGVRASNKVADAASLATFIATWASATSNDLVSDLARPVFDAATFYPPLTGVPSDQNHRPVCDKERKLVTKRFIFNSEKVTLLRGTPAATTRFEAVAALVWRCAARVRCDAKRASTAMILVDIRSRMDPPPGGFLFGNLFTLAVSSAVVIEDDKDEREKRRLEQELRSATKSIDANFVGKLKGPKGAMLAAEKTRKVVKDYMKNGGDHSSIDFYFFNSWLRLPLHNANFGSGKPVWVGSAGEFLTERNVLLMEGDSGVGMEAWVTLEEKEMVRFEQEEELADFIAYPPHVIA